MILAIWNVRGSGALKQLCEAAGKYGIDIMTVQKLNKKEKLSAVQ